METFRFINEQFFADAVTADQTDLLLADGWRHFGSNFFRYNLGFHNDEIRLVHALRIDLGKFGFSRSQRRNLARNSDLDVSFATAVIDDEVRDLFNRHKTRFTWGVPNSVYDFVSNEPARIPCETLACTVRHHGKLLAVSFFETGNHSVSSIYGMFDPAETKRGLGILTMLHEIRFALAKHKKYYYHGYIYEGRSFYDYKKRFRGLEIFDWMGNWTGYRDNQGD